MRDETCEKPADAAFLVVPVARSAVFRRRDDKLPTTIAVLGHLGQP